MNAPLSLQEVVEMAIRRHGTSARQLGLLASGRGFKITHTTLNQIRNGTYKSIPSPETLRALAWLAGVPEDVAFTAAGQPVPGPPLADELPPGADNLSPKSRKAVLDMMRVLIDLESGHEYEASNEPPAQPTELGAVRERRHGQAIGSGQKIPGYEHLERPALEDLAAHPYFKTTAEKNSEFFDGLGEDNQDHGGEHE